MNSDVSEKLRYIKVKLVIDYYIRGENFYF